MTIKDFVKTRKEELKVEFAKFKSVSKFVIVQMNEDPASEAYIRGKLKDGSELGVNVELRKFPLDFSHENLLNEIDKLNKDDSVTGFIVQMPLPKQIDEESVKLAISPKKDVDGFHPLSKLNPCTPQGIMNYLDHEHIDLLGKNAVVIGRSNIVGKPMAKLLLSRSANVTVLHSKTSFADMHRYLENADIIVVAVGKKHLIDDKFKFKKDAVIIDVGINRDEDGLKGDCINNLPVKLQTPVPGGVGLLTRLALYENLLKICKGEN
ncbi:MAG: bifunctional 5,10-methylenetetrahydrofolate dehydrogenase/5,10-methenyltetrahydrofolate cyclohydrolase [Bacilli bacterium]|nr:bifunctional 5,10-methylenetetrahydrofolate dehydrogenase/5,10-methenyltetrahydrofolate cyclohydrolase [Bacilli bacterium]